MNDRSVVVRLKVDAAQFIATMKQASQATAEVGAASEKAAKRSRASMDKLGNAALLAGGAITAGLGLGVKAFADFDEAMSSVNAALPEAGAQMEKLRNLAIDLGKDTQFSTTEAAQGITELAKAGVDANAILGGGLKGSLDLAAAGSLDVARAAEVSATALKQFNLQGSDLPHVADLYAAAAGKAQGSVEDIAQAMKFAGVTANGLGISLDETVGTLGLFADAGIIGEQAGTSLRSLLLSLTAPSVQAAGTMKALGISVYDAQGSFIGIGGAAQELQVELGKVDEQTRNAALGTIFGNESINAARELYEGGARAVAQWTGKVNDAGFAAEQAAAKTDNLKGDVERLGGALDAVFVQNGEGANGALRNLTQGLEGAVETFGRLPQPVQQTAIGLAAITGAGLLAFGAFAKIATTGADLLESMDALRERSPRLAKGLDATGVAARKAAKAMLALAAAGAVVEFFSDDTVAIGTEKLTNALLSGGDAVAEFSKIISDNATEMGTIQDNLSSFGDVLQTTFDPGFWDGFDRKGDAALKAITLGMLDLDTKTDEANQRLSELDSALSGLAGSGNGDKAATLFGQLAEGAAAQGVSVDDLKSKLPQYTEALAATDNQQLLAAGSAGDMAENVGGIEKAADDAQEKVDTLAEAIRNFGAGALSVDEARSNFEESADAVEERLAKRVELQKQLREEQAKSGEDRDPEKIADLKNELKDYALTLDQSTKAGRENSALLRDQAQDTLELSASTLEQTGSSEKAAAAMAEGREEFVKSAIQLGATKKEAEALADKYELIPSQVKTTVKAEGAATARTQVQNLIDTIARLNSKSVAVGVRYTYTGVRPNGGRSTAGGITADADGAMHVRSGAGLVKAYADGGVHTLGAAQPQIARAGGAGILWAEEGAGPWEAFISGHPAKRTRSRSIAADTVQRLGGRVEWRRFADGGMYGPGRAGAVSRQTTNHTPVYVDKVVAADYSDFLEQAEQAKRDRALGGPY